MKNEFFIEKLYHILFLAKVLFFYCFLEKNLKNSIFIEEIYKIYQK